MTPIKITQYLSEVMIFFACSVIGLAIGYGLRKLEAALHAQKSLEQMMEWVIQDLEEGD